MSTIADEYEPLEVIGRGSFGTVRKVRQKDTGVVLVRKEIEYTSMNNQEKNHIISELRILRELDHPHIVKYLRHDHIQDKKAIHIYQEYCDGGDLGKIIGRFKRDKESIPEEFIWEVLVQTLLALHRCHYGIDAKKVNLFAGAKKENEPMVNSETVIIHRDIKPENIFIMEPKKTIKLGDFGLAKMLTSQNDFAKTYVGTPYYMSPEVLMDNPYSPVCDIWSLGCVLFELCNLHPPFQAKTHLQLQAKIRSGEIPEISPVYSLHLRNIINESITVDAESRPTCYELLNSISVRMFRKEMELKNLTDTLNAFQKQLVIKSNELKKRESALKTLEVRETAKKQLEEDVIMSQRKLQKQREELENELRDDFEMRKKAMDQEGKEMRLYYQKEFKHVVEQEVQARLSEILRKKMSSGDTEGELRRKKSDSSSTSFELPLRTHLPNKPKGPREFIEESPKAMYQHQYQAHSGQLQNPHQYQFQYRAQQHAANSHHVTQQHRSPLQIRNVEVESLPVRPTETSGRKRLTDEFERINLQKRNTPEFEEQYMRQNYRY
ncbi:kinase-like protein [Metschnikowia bicuspidata var. bicuspidata NRRL YB-4993]|uniref:non-specific serine/threonine protein kinase n=1 Tax=Metschnikowia bicuspidata var. bicuspidata NRRL YB-4993 TaxID=869754 RepID=A0A1A0HAX9_9ASCO|nr:kinase-like protein [Metschnikowia bicuspidata var. bicuspidata NRRL YB-4993]OBA21150.1 kinase-like protein [Metschnikowia bicuspidata var. bicuspidata NRRL YB-4993]